MGTGVERHVILLRREFSRKNAFDGHQPSPTHSLQRPKLSQAVSNTSQSASNSTEAWTLPGPTLGTGVGSQSVGWHADDEKLFGGLIHDCTIVSLSLGVTRESAIRDHLQQCMQITVFFHNSSDL